MVSSLKCHLKVDTLFYSNSTELKILALISSYVEGT